MNIKKMRVIPLGGLNEIGKNMTIYEYNNEIIVVDCGLKFPDEELLGIDLVIQNWNYLIENKSKLKAMLITHGHEDHIGAIPYFLKDFNVPIYATKLTYAMILGKLEEHKYSFKPNIKILDPDRQLKIGAFTIDAIRVTHSIPDCVAFSITTDVGTIIQTGDFKVDYTPIDGKPIDLQKFADIGSRGVIALLPDSTNADRPGFTISEAKVSEAFDKIFRQNHLSRIMVASFSSNVHRVQQIVDKAYEFGRKVAFSGRSMESNVYIASEYGYLNIPEPNMVIDIEDIDGYPDNEICIITTGSQGETFSALSRIAADSHSSIQIRKGDVVIFSSSPIPGNERSINRVINKLYEKGANVIYHSLELVHVSGHACQEEIKLIHNLVKPKFYVPVHGEYTHLIQNSNLARSLGTSKDNIFLLKNGDILEFVNTDGKITAEVVGTVEAGSVLIDGLGIGDVGNIVLRDRRILSEEGLIAVSMVYSSEGKRLQPIDLITRGFVYVRNSEEFLSDAREYLHQMLDGLEANGVKDWATIKTKVKSELSDYIFQQMRRRPMILPIMVKV